MVREWTRSGLLEATQGARLGEELCVELRRTNPFLRAGLALFTGLIVAASVALILTLLDLRDDVAIAAITGLSALASIGLAEYVVLRFRCYRFGVEEALAVAAVVLLSIAGGELTSSFHVEVRGMPAIVALLIGSAGGFGLYRRFGFVDAACGGIVCAAAIPFQLDLPAASQRVLAAAVRRKFPAALIDEFHDTDPVQYEIFRTLYRSKATSLFLIGDPKQAIYAFRGADVFAYLGAARGVKCAGDQVVIVLIGIG